jgi:thiosulfate dehydrogenase [quinone] large subunit
VGDDIAVAPDRAARTVVAAGRIVVGLLWMSNAGWKVPPAFGENGNRDLYRFTSAAVDQPVFPPFSFVVEHVVLPNFRFFGWLVLLVEIALGAFLTFGIATRLWAVVGGVHATVIALCVLRLRGEWPWSYYLMIVANLLLFATAAGRFAGIDGVVRPALANSRARLAHLWWKVS